MGTVREETVTRKVGETFTATFNEMGSAGYLWSCTAKPEGLEVTSEREQPKTDMIGGALKKTFSAVCNDAGTFEIEFQHKRPWNAEVAETVRYTLHVNP